MLTIKLEDLAASALTESIEKNGVNEVSVPQLMIYGSLIYDELKKQNNKVVLDINLTTFIKEHGLVFNTYKNNDIAYIGLQNGIDIEYLKKHFKACQTLTTLMSFTSLETLQSLSDKKR